MIIKNSSGKNIGNVSIANDQIIVENNSKPQLVISDTALIKEIFCDLDEEIIRPENILVLYDKYFLTIGELAAIYQITYGAMNKYCRALCFQTSLKAGRRNSSFGKKFSDTRKSNMVQGRKNNGSLGKTHSGPNTQEWKDKISATLLQKYASGELVQDPQKHIDNWANGVYSDVNFNRGIGGTFFSKKNQKTIMFRSLLELKFSILLEEDDSVSEYLYEPFAITMTNGHTYTPDYLVNGRVIELKMRKFIKNLGGEVKDNFERKCLEAQRYCVDNGLTYEVVWGEDLGFETSKFKRELVHSNNHSIEEYNIQFFDPSRVGL